MSKVVVTMSLKVGVEVEVADADPERAKERARLLAAEAVEARMRPQNAPRFAPVRVFSLGWEVTSTSEPGE